MSHDLEIAARSAAQCHRELTRTYLDASKSGCSLATLAGIRTLLAPRSAELAGVLRLLAVIDGGGNETGNSNSNSNGNDNGDCDCDCS
jgi:hypothetical protein